MNRDVVYSLPAKLTSLWSSAIVFGNWLAVNQTESSELWVNNFNPVTVDFDHIQS